MAPKYPSIPEPTIAPESLRDAVLTIKQAFEVLTGQRGNQDYRAVLLPELTASDNAKVSKSGDTMTGGLSMGSAVASGPGDVTRHIALYANTYGFSITSGTLNIVSDGVVMMQITNAAVSPAVSGTKNLGSAALRWGTVYTSDLSLKNDHGDWTIVEGEDDLFIYNNKRGKIYKFALVEVGHPSEAPPKKV